MVIRPSGEIATMHWVAVGAATIILGGAGDAGPDRGTGSVAPRRFLIRALSPDRMGGELVENLQVCG